MEFEKREQDFLPVEFRRVRGEVDAAQSTAVMARPATVRPGSHDDAVGDARIVLLDRVIYPQRSHQVLGVEPATHREYRTADVFQVPPDCAGLPILIVGGMRDDFVPRRIGTSE